MKTAMILLVGEQPAPNLLPTRHLAPDVALLVYTQRTRPTAENLETLLEPNPSCLLCSVSPYAIPEIQDVIQRFLSEHLSGYALTHNLTGGTKPEAHTQAVEWLKAGLENLGAGAKTAAGYGYFELIGDW